MHWKYGDIIWIASSETYITYSKIWTSSKTYKAWFENMGNSSYYALKLVQCAFKY
jgi:hypothetical protein